MLSYWTKAELQNATVVDTSKLAAKSDWACLKAGIDKIDLEKLKTVPDDLRKPSNVLKNEVVKKTVYDKLVAEVNNIDTSGFALKTRYDTDKQNLEKKISDADKNVRGTSGLVKKVEQNAKIIEIESKIPSISGLATSSASAAVENKVPDVSSLVQKNRL